MGTTALAIPSPAFSSPSGGTSARSTAWRIAANTRRTSSGSAWLCTFIRVRPWGIRFNPRAIQLAPQKLNKCAKPVGLEEFSQLIVQFIATEREAGGRFLLDLGGDSGNVGRVGCDDAGMREVAGQGKHLDGKLFLGRHPGLPLEFPAHPLGVQVTPKILAGEFGVMQCGAIGGLGPQADYQIPKFVNLAAEGRGQEERRRVAVPGHALCSIITGPASRS
jgi:hypothetical protein